MLLSKINGCCAIDDAGNNDGCFVVLTNQLLHKGRILKIVFFRPKDRNKYSGSRVSIAFIYSLLFIYERI